MKELMKKKVESDMKMFDECKNALLRDIDAIRLGLKECKTFEARNSLLNQARHILSTINRILKIESLKNVEVYQNIDAKSLSILLGKDWGYIEDFNRRKLQHFIQSKKCIEDIIDKIFNIEVSQITQPKEHQEILKAK